MRRLAAPLCTLLVVALLPAAAAAGWREERPEAVTDSDYRDGGVPKAAEVELGRLLFFDKILSGNENIACATCHHPFAGTADGLALSVGEGARGLASARDLGEGDDAVVERVPRNAPALFNLGAREFTVMFHDGRVAEDPSQPSGFLSPAGDDLPPGLASALAAQAMFPVTSNTEMAGQAGENPQADAAAAGDLAGPDGVWEILAAKLRNIPEYVDRFVAVYTDVNGADDVAYVHAANAIAAFEAATWRADQSPFDRFLRGDRRALSPAARRGMQLFYGRVGCADCHSGPFQTDHDFHAIAVPPVGPGKGDGHEGHDDFGRSRETGDPDDRYRFRTPSLRNVALTGPWMHNGSYDTLRSALLHHLDPEGSLENYDRSQLALPSRPDLDARDFVALDDEPTRAAIAAANELEPPRRALSERDVEDLLAFLHALTDPASVDLRRDVPPRVPSGLPVGD